ncbi:branched-chain amino acid ABC transporter permease [Bdellovibrio sp. 22V]|uniref:branched-chain amino acid ABC transporter permease n=1 Tax=Bdellovibrio TaxID=958 RepID=UPI002543A939|nr:branched-chain amino acid ABC transporter permease [Bdellovibrio sp. 22V]WII72376.1 branched-chain amino acid ABC transporter permease [Bdellovibrio sp. 22V]
MQDFIQHIINGISLGSIYALIALGYTMVYGILKMINFAHSDVYMVGAFAAYYVARFFGIEANPGLPTLITLLVASMVVCSLLGLAIERLAYRPLRSSPKLNILITAIGVSLFLEYGGQVVFGADPKVFPEVMKDFVLFNIGSVELKSFDVTVLVVSLIAMLGLQFLIHKTKIGKAMRAVSSNASVASLLGMNPDRIIAFTFIVGSALAGVGSVLVGMKYPKIDPLMGMMIGLKAFVAAVLGGIGNVGGAVLGALIMGLSEEMVVAYISSTYRDALAFGILIVILIFKPAGLLGKYTVEKV